MSNQLIDGMVAIFSCLKDVKTGKSLNKLLAIADTYKEASQFIEEQNSGVWCVKKWDGVLKLGEYEK